MTRRNPNNGGLFFGMKSLKITVNLCEFAMLDPPKMRTYSLCHPDSVVARVFFAARNAAARRITGLPVGTSCVRGV